ncbi:hypothetical protein CAI18_00810 [Xanthomonas citri pv. punicae]|nr:hypothetical protein CAI14_20360 [Xanthomonas citri pv. punicae]QCZ70223.1 hypothetical protein CAI17_17995 [Xanthomonas citri pv. punicae]QCZ73338.1 hypothetical protein CAB38_11775 [Xanthomonas citri pv. punicae]QCZ79085.1 hypothetical protein XapA_22305 [Xanthomonas citri pv. punicae]QCZ80100.1 hypothetical protein XapB_02820 [Xanthomonas citri pv. punicae]
MLLLAQCWVLPRKHGRLWKGGRIQILPCAPSPHPRIVAPFDLFEHIGLIRPGLRRHSRPSLRVAPFELYRR